MSTITPEELAQLQKKFSEIRYWINNDLAVMMALSEMSQRPPRQPIFRVNGKAGPDVYREKLARTVLAKAPQIVSRLLEFTQALNDKAGH